MATARSFGAASMPLMGAPFVPSPPPPPKERRSARAAVVAVFTSIAIMGGLWFGLVMILGAIATSQAPVPVSDIRASVASITGDAEATVVDQTVGKSRFVVVTWSLPGTGDAKIRAAAQQHTLAILKALRDARVDADVVVLEGRRGKGVKVKTVLSLPYTIAVVRQLKYDTVAPTFVWQLTMSGGRMIPDKFS